MMPVGLSLVVCRPVTNPRLSGLNKSRAKKWISRAACDYAAIKPDTCRRYTLIDPSFTPRCMIGYIDA